MTREVVYSLFDEPADHLFYCAGCDGYLDGFESFMHIVKTGGPIETFCCECEKIMLLSIEGRKK